MQHDDNKRQLIMNYKQVFNSEKGAAVLDNLNSLCGANVVTLPTDNAGRIDPLMKMYHEGARSVIVHIKNQLEIDLHEKKQETAEQ